MMAEKCDQKNKLIKKKIFKNSRRRGKRKYNHHSDKERKKRCERDMGGCKLRK